MTAPKGNPMAPLLLGATSPGFPISYRTGKVLAWDAATGSNTIRVDGVDHTDVPVVPGAAVVAPRTGDPISLMAVADSHGVTSYLVTGVPIQPPDDRLAALVIPEGGGGGGGGGGGDFGSITFGNHIPTVGVQSSGTAPTYATKSGTYSRIIGNGAYDVITYSFFYYFSSEGTSGGLGTLYSISVPDTVLSSEVRGVGWGLTSYPSGEFFQGVVQPDGFGGVCIVVPGSPDEGYPLGPGNWPGSGFGSDARMGGTITYATNH